MHEPETRLAICVSAENAQAVRKLLELHKIWDCSRKLVRISDEVAIPIHSQSLSELSVILQDFPEFEVKELLLPLSARSAKKSEGQKLKEALKILLRTKNISEGLLEEVPRKWERHGDLILLPSSSFSSPHWGLLGDELWKTVASALACHCLAKLLPVSNDGYRTPQVSMLLGHDGKVTHVDNGIKYSFDVTKCMFSSGNITEKLRVASWDCSNETVVDLYAGIGYFTLPYLVHARARHVHACEWNPDAVEALKETLTLNKVDNRCTIHQGDNRQVQLCNLADRVNLGLIPSSEDGWRVAARVLKPSGGVLHIHQNVTVSPSNSTTRQDAVELNDTGTDILSKDFACLCRDEGGSTINTQGKLLHSSHGNPDCCSTRVSGYLNYCGCDSDSETGLGSNHCMVCRDKKQAVYIPWARETAQRIQSFLEEEKCMESWRCCILHIEKVKSYAPHIDHVVLDLKCWPTGV